MAARLYQLVRGTTGNGNITLEQYVQAAGFDHIILAANRRLLPMSDGQYGPYRKENSLGKQSNTFLDLEVLDNFTGCRRPVGNLSGTGKLVGIISHREELKESIPQQIKIEKSKAGSRIIFCLCFPVL